MRLEAVLVCVDYGDFLAHSLPLNKALFDRMVVVTASHDEETRRLCDYHHVECLVTDVMYENNAPFNKGKAINAGLGRLGFKDWVAHLDADVVLPAKTRSLLEQIPLNDQFIYGIDRMMCPSYDQWARFSARPLPQHELSYVHVGPFPVGTRLLKLEDNVGGYIPLGFFQLFHRNAKVLKKPVYPEDWDTAGGSDCTFAYQWPRVQRHLLPEFLAIHLDSERGDNGKMGENWKGRATPRFEPRDPFATVLRPRPITEV